MRKIALASVLVAATALTVAGTVALAGRGGERHQLRAGLIGYQEVPVKSTTGHGRFQATVQDDGIHYTLQYEGLETDALFAHIHFGQPAVNGGISAFLCNGTDTPACPAREGTVEGVIEASDVVGPNDQGIEPGSLAELVQAMRAGVTYANVHTTRFTGGEIRGQIRPGRGGPPHRSRSRPPRRR